jgi:GDP-D-mannose dehydratase
MQKALITGRNGSYLAELLREVLGWQPKVTFQTLVESMVDRHVAELTAAEIG